MRNVYVNVLDDAQPELRKKSIDVSLPLNKEDEKTIKGLLKYVVDSRDEDKAEKYGLQPASGLAAPQIGINKKMIAIVIDEKINDEEYEEKQYALINPKIISYSEQDSYIESGEGCLSVPKAHEGYVKRHARITVEAYDYLNKEKVSIRARGYFAIVLQHEIDHLDGILYYDRINKKDPFAPIDGAIVI